MYHDHPDAPTPGETADIERSERLTKDYIEVLLPHAEAILLRLVGVGDDLPGEGRLSMAPEELFEELAFISAGGHNLDVMEFLVRMVGESPEDIQDPDRYGDY